MTPARYIMIGGFLGAGKTTSILRLAQYFDAKGLKVGLITNDQGHRLVDTMNLKSRGFAVEEIAGGCFCCRFNSLMDAANHLEEQNKPDVFIAEPVGSCTDLIASVSYPLRRIYGDRFEVAPLSVVVDPNRAARVLGIGEGRPFSEKVSYIYLKQLEEAAIIVINKTDLLDAQHLADLKAALAERFPNKPILSASALEEDGLEQWFQAISEADTSAEPTMQLDYQIYAEGEAALGWLNATVALNTEEMIDGDELLRDLANKVRNSLETKQAEIAHFKMTLSPDDESGELAVLSMVGNAWDGHFSQTLSDPLNKGQLIVNLRAEGDPDTLEQALHTAVNSNPHLTLDHFECFKPSEPKPVYRMTTPDMAL